MTWGLLLLTLVTLAASFASISVVLDRYQERELDQALLVVARAEAEEAPLNHFSFSPGPGPAANDVGPLEKYGVMFDDQGAPLSATAPFDAAAPRLETLDSALETPFDFTFADRRYRGVVVGIPGYPQRRLLLAASRNDLDGDSRFVRKAMGIAFAASVAWLFAAIGWIIRRNMREHRRIAETLRRIATGDTRARVAGEVSDLELRRVGSDVDEIAERLGHLVRNQRRFIAHAAHELRSPLAALHGELQSVLRKERTVEDYKKSLTFSLRASTRLKHLADELLELAKAEEAAEQAEPVSLGEVLSDVVESLAPLASEKDVRIVHHANELLVMARPRDLERVVRNLLDNAIRYSPRGGEVRIRVAVDEAVAVHVDDDGPGVPLEERERIFEPFHRSPEARTEARGAGLGLAIARELAQQHGGDLHMGARPSEFVLQLRRAPAPS